MTSSSTHLDKTFSFPAPVAHFHWTKRCADHISGSHLTVAVFYCGDNRIVDILFYFTKSNKYLTPNGSECGAGHVCEFIQNDTKLLLYLDK